MTREGRRRRKITIGKNIMRSTPNTMKARESLEVWRGWLGEELE
jgi:hypothetical protein